MGPQLRRTGPLGRRLLAAPRATHAPDRARRTPDRSPRGPASPASSSPHRRAPHRRSAHHEQHGGQVTNTLPTPAGVDPRALQEVLDGRWGHVRRDARENLRDPDFLPVYGESMQEARERVTRAAKKLADSGRAGLRLPKE